MYVGGVRYVRTRSIPNSPEEVLALHALRIHNRTHTVYGLMAWDEPRRQLVVLGRKVRAITAELGRRGAPIPPVVADCRFCVAS